MMLTCPCVVNCEHVYTDNDSPAGLVLVPIDHPPQRHSLSPPHVTAQ